jgi:hypothetical protein
MDVTGDELAGVVDLFGGLTEDQLARALAELAFKQGDEHDPSTFEDDIEDAVADYRLVELDPAELDADDRDAANLDSAADDPILVVGPAALPRLPESASDLQHILDAPQREIPSRIAGERAADRFRQEAATAIDDGDQSRVATLLDVSYDIEAWAPVDLAAERERLNDLT